MRPSVGPRCPKATYKSTGAEYATAGASGGSQAVHGDNRGHVTASAKPGASSSGHGTGNGGAGAASKGK